VRVVCASASEVALPAADVIYVTPAPRMFPDAWLDALKPGGRMVLPLSPHLAYVRC
jgi:protein-L-isoaspartate(D-aspartate) O-methyltransferase